jgi:hypothetical protein
MRRFVRYSVSFCEKCGELAGCRRRGESRKRSCEHCRMKPEKSPNCTARLAIDSRAKKSGLKIAEQYVGICGKCSNDPLKQTA